MANQWNKVTNMADIPKHDNFRLKGRHIGNCGIGMPVMLETLFSYIVLFDYPSLAFRIFQINCLAALLR